MQGCIAQGIRVDGAAGRQGLCDLLLPGQNSVLNCGAAHAILQVDVHGRIFNQVQSCHGLS